MIDLDARAAAAQLEIREMAMTARRSLGQRFRKIRRRSQERFDALFEEYDHSLVWYCGDDECATPGE